jgi:predicted ATPase
MFVLALEGCHGCGKTALIRQFQEMGYETLDEAFLNMPKSSLHPQSLTMETCWMSIWFQRLLHLDQEFKARKIDTSKVVLVADRSPFSAVLYSKNNGQLLNDLIAAQIQELKAVDIHVLSCLVSVDEPVLWARIQKRLEREPNRSLYNEDKREWMETVLSFYNGRDDWDLVIDNTSSTVAESCQRVLAMLKDLTNLESVDPVSCSPSTSLYEILSDPTSPSMFRLSPVQLMVGHE